MECPIGQLKASGTAPASSDGGDGGDDEDEAIIAAGGDGGGVGGASDAPLDGEPHALRAGSTFGGRYGAVSPVGCDMTIHRPDIMLGSRRRLGRASLVEVLRPSSGARASTSRRGGMVCARLLSPLTRPGPSAAKDRCEPSGVVQAPIRGMRSFGMSDASFEGAIRAGPGGDGVRGDGGDNGSTLGGVTC